MPTLNETHCKQHTRNKILWSKLFKPLQVPLSAMIFTTVPQLVSLERRESRVVHHYYNFFFDLVILNPTVTVILIYSRTDLILQSQLNYLVPHIRERSDNEIFCYWMSLFLKVERINYTMSTCDLLGIYTITLGQVRIY